MTKKEHASAARAMTPDRAALADEPFLRRVIAQLGEYRGTVAVVNVEDTGEALHADDLAAIIGEFVDRRAALRDTASPDRAALADPKIVRSEFATIRAAVLRYVRDDRESWDLIAKIDTLGELFDLRAAALRDTAGAGGKATEGAACIFQALSEGVVAVCSVHGGCADRCNFAPPTDSVGRAAGSDEPPHPFFQHSHDEFCAEIVRAATSMRVTGASPLYTLLLDAHDLRGWGNPAYCTVCGPAIRGSAENASDTDRCATCGRPRREHNGPPGNRAWSAADCTFQAARSDEPRPLDAEQLLSNGRILTEASLRYKNNIQNARFEAGARWARDEMMRSLGSRASSVVAQETADRAALVAVVRRALREPACTEFTITDAVLAALRAVSPGTRCGDEVVYRLECPFRPEGHRNHSDHSPNCFVAAQEPE